MSRIDTGGSNRRQELARALESAGCTPGLLKLILLTHGDFDHTGNAAYLRHTFGGKIAMHSGDAGMVELGDMFVNRKRPNFLIRILLPLFTGFGSAEHFTPDLLVEDGDELSEYGIDGRIISIPGHSKGSIGVLVGGSGLICGDLMENTREPKLNSLIDNVDEAAASLKKLGSMKIGMVYPGHGRPFSLPLVLTGTVDWDDKNDKRCKMSTMETIQIPSFRKRLVNRIRYFNREYFNPFAMSFAGRPHSFWSVILHKGRKSG